MNYEELKNEYKMLINDRYNTSGTLAVDDEIVEMRNNRIAELSELLKESIA